MQFLSTIELSNYLSLLDWIIFIAVLAITLAIVIYGNRLKSNNSLLEYLLMGRQLSLPLFIATLVAT